MLTQEYLILIYGAFFVGTMVFALLLNSLLLKFSKTLGARNNGENLIRWNSETKPALGGISFYVIFLFSFALYSIFFNGTEVLNNKRTLGLLACCSLAFLAGLADDAYNTKPFLKFSAQLSCAIILIFSDTYIQLFENTILNYTLTIFWVVGMMNSINMLDNMDAITTTVSIVIISGIILLQLLYQDITNIYFLILIGALSSLIGFLYFNWHPSKMFMGDTGSQFLGALLAAMGITFFWNTPYSEIVYPSKGILAVALVFVIPIVDTTTVVINRLLKKQSPFVGGKDHTTHHLFYNGITERRIAVLFAIISLVSVLFTILINRYIKEWNAFYTGLFSAYFVIIFIVLYSTTKLKTKKA